MSILKKLRDWRKRDKPAELKPLNLPKTTFAATDKHPVEIYHNPAMAYMAIHGIQHSSSDYTPSCGSSDSGSGGGCD